MTDFATTIAQAYTTQGPAIELGQGVHNGALVHEAVVKVPLKMMNRHGLIAGATGTGKTRTLQGLAEQLSAAGVAVFLADVKGDVSEIADPGDPASPAGKRATDLGIPFTPTAFPAEYLSLRGIGSGIPVRTTVSDFGPQLLGKVLESNETQEQSLGLVFRYADQKGLPLLDLSDLRAVLTFLTSDEGKADADRDRRPSFDGATKAFIESITQTVRLIRSKGVGVFFITQVPKDIHDDVLGQLGNRVQHALRAFTPDDAAALHAAVKTYPKSEFYDLEQLLTQLGTGEAAVTILSDSGVPTPVVHTRLRPPFSRMGATDDVDKSAKASPLFSKYGTRVDNQSAREMLAARMEQSAAPAAAPPSPAPQPQAHHKEAAGAIAGGAAVLSTMLNSSAGRQVEREVIRGVFGILKKSFR